MPHNPLAAYVVAITLAISGLPGSVLAAEPAKVSVSPAAAKAMKGVKDAADQKKFAEVITRARAVLALPGRTPADAFVAYQFMTVAYQGQGNRAEMLTALQGQLDSGYASAAQRNQILKNMVGIAFELKNYPKVAEYGNRLIESGAADASTYALVGHALFLQGKYANASKLLSEHVKQQIRSRQTPREATLTTLRAAQDKQGDHAGVADTLEKLVIYYPKPDYWNLLAYSVTKDSKLTDRQTLQLFRLKMATGTLKRCQDYSDMEDIAVAAGMPGEAQKVIEEAISAKVCTVKTDEDRLRRHLTANSNVVARDKARFAQLEAEANASSTGTADVAIGSQLFGYGEYAKAAQALSRGITKGGLKNAPDAQLTLATAQYRAGNKADALKTLRSIKPEDPVTQRIARLWILYVQ